MVKRSTLQFSAERHSIDLNVSRLFRYIKNLNSNSNAHLLNFISNSNEVGEFVDEFTCDNSWVNVKTHGITLLQAAPQS